MYMFSVREPVCIEEMHGGTWSLCRCEQRCYMSVFVSHVNGRHIEQGRILGLHMDNGVETGPPRPSLAQLLRRLPLWLCCGREKAKDLASFRLAEAERRLVPKYHQARPLSELRDLEERSLLQECLQRAREAGEGDKPSMCFMRQDILTGKWAHFQLGTGNDKKPRQTESKSKQVKMRPIHEEPEQLSGCPFCALQRPMAGDVLRFEKRGRIWGTWDLRFESTATPSSHSKGAEERRGIWS
eukprot:s2538_g17.t1